MLDIRSATEADREAIGLVRAFSFNGPQPSPSDVPVLGALCATEAGRVVGTAGAHEFEQFFGGARVRGAGVYGVAVLPEHRGRGVAGALVRELLIMRRATGDAVSVLYPANSQLYRKLGYEYAGLHPSFLVPIADLPPSRTGVELADVTDQESVAALRACFCRFAAQHNGPVDWTCPSNWARRALAHQGEGLHQRTVVVPGPANVEGYASYFTSYDSERRSVVATAKHFVALSSRALDALLGYFRRFENSAGYLLWPGAPTAAPIGLAASTNGFAMSPSVSRWMLRVLDVARALEARGYPAGADAEVVFSIEDAMFPANAGPWRLKVSGGRASVEPAPTAPGKPLPVRFFSALYSGFAGPSDLVALGCLDQDDPRIGALSALFAGPTPWMPDSF